MGETSAMSGNLNCSGKTGSSVIRAAEKSLRDFKNPYDTSRKALTDGGDITNDNDVGYIRMRSPGSKIEVMSCIQTPCSATRCSSDNHICSGDINLN